LKGTAGSLSSSTFKQLKGEHRISVHICVQNAIIYGIHNATHQFHLQITLFIIIHYCIAIIGRDEMKDTAEKVIRGYPDFVGRYCKLYERVKRYCTASPLYYIL